MFSRLPQRRLFVCVLGISLLSGLPSVGAGDRGRTLVERSAKKRPGWIVRPPQSDEGLFSVGIATGAASLDEGRTAAALDAVEDVVFYLGLRASARYEQRRTHLTNEILSLIETSGSAEVTGGRTAELYFERYRTRGAAASRNVYDVYVLFRVPHAELEAERSRILAERAQAKRRAAALVAETSFESLAEDFIGGLARLAGARRELERAAPGSSTMNRIDVLFDEIGVRTRLSLEAVEPESGDARLRVVTAGAVLVGEAGPLPLRGVPLEFEVAQGAERETTTAVTLADGSARVTIGFPLDPFRRALVRVRLHPSLLAWNDDGSGGATPDAGLARLEVVEDYRVVHLVATGSATAPTSTERALEAGVTAVAVRDPTRVPGAGPRISITAGTETGWTGRPFAVRLPVLVQVAASPPEPGGPPPLNLALVLDCSDSIYESGRIDELREAAAFVVRTLGRGDVLTIVTYGERPTVLLPARGVEARRALLYEVSRLGPCGRSNLSAGIERAMEEILPHVRPGSVSRMLVLTDGRPNEGTTESEGLVRLARRNRTAGVPLSVVGLGAKTNRGLLEQVAAAGGGRFSQAASASSLPGILARELGDALPRRAADVSIELKLAPAASLVRAYGYPVHVSERSVEVLAGGIPVGESRSVLLDLEVDCSNARVKWIGKIVVNYRERSRPGGVAQLSRSLSAACAPGRSVPTPIGETRYVDLYARLGRAADTLEVVLYNWDPRLLQEMDTFLATEQPKIRREVEALDDPELDDLVAFIDRGAVEMWAGVSKLAEAIERPDPKLFPEYRLFKLKHWNTQLKSD